MQIMFIHLFTNGNSWRIRWIKNKHPKNLYVQQIDHAADAMEQFVVQSFYKETSKKRFIQSIQSVQYTLKTTRFKD